MRYMLMMHAPRGTGDYQINSWAPKDLKAHIDFMVRLNRELTEKGELVAVEGLTPPGQAEIAAKASSAPGPGGTPLIIPIEVRQVMSGPPEA
jgi:hypothetical protein